MRVMAAQRMTSVASSGSDKACVAHDDERLCAEHEREREAEPPKPVSGQCVA
jgi:hypothetical protein